MGKKKQNKGHVKPKNRQGCTYQPNRLRITDYIVSDWHLGDGSGSDDSIPYVGKLENMLKSMQIGANVWFIGDTFEMAQLLSVGDFYRMLDTKAGILEILKFLTVHMAPGNHDLNIPSLGKIAFWETEPQLFWIERDGTRIAMTHGHQWDFFNRPGAKIGPAITYTASVMERLGMEDIDRISRPCHYVWRGAYMRSAAAAAKRHEASVIFKGHSHHASDEMVEGVRVIDTGSPLEPNDKGGIPYGVILEGGYVQLCWTDKNGKIEEKRGCA